MTTTMTTDRATTVRLALRAGMLMRRDDLNRAYSPRVFSIRRVPAERAWTCSRCAKRMRGGSAVVGDYATVAYCHTVYVHVQECPGCALEAAISDETGVSCRLGEVL